jgi:1,4-alpha-glucan branching enzyme
VDLVQDGVQRDQDAFTQNGTGSGNLSPLTGYWRTSIPGVKPRSAVSFRFQDSHDRWHPFTPIAALERVYATHYVPDLRYGCRQSPPVYDRARVLLETTLEGLLSGYAGGRLAPRSREELFQTPIARTILKTDIPGILSEWGIDQLMVPLTSSVADRSYLNPKFNYLTYDVADIDWQIGQHHDFVELVDRFHEVGITIVPDLIFVHQVSRCFEGSLDTLTCPNAKGEERPFFVDENAFQFRDYGTWMFRLEEPAIRQQIIDKIVTLVDFYRLKMIRLDYVDGLLLQYAHRPINYGEIFLKELRKALKTYDPQLLILGEAFAVIDHPTVKGAIDIFYAPSGFAITEELYKPGDQRDRPLFPDLHRIADEIYYFTHWPRRRAVYAQLHDETCADEHIAAARSHVPWAYGQNPAELARQQGQSLVELELLPQQQLLDYVRRLVRNTEALTLFSADLLYMFSPGVDALTLDSSDKTGNWRVHWDRVTLPQLRVWQATGLTEHETIALHHQHHWDMIALRQIFRHYTWVNPQSGQPLTEISICHLDPENAVLALLRRTVVPNAPQLLVIFNLGGNTFSDSGYELPLTANLTGTWEILFHGDDLRSANEEATPNPQLHTHPGTYWRDRPVLKLHFQPWSLVVLARL